MANDKDINIGLHTVGADAAATEIAKVPDAIKQIPGAIDQIPESAPDAVKSIDDITESIFRMRDEAQQAQDELDNIEAARRKAARESTGGLLGKDVTAAADASMGKLADQAGLGKQYKALSAMVSADSAAMIGSFAAVGVAAVKSYEMLDGTLERFDKLRTLAAETGQSLGPELESQLAGLRETMEPIKTVIDAVGGALDKVWKTVKDPVGELSGANALEEAFKRQAEALKALNDTRLKIANDRQNDLKDVYNDELAALREQEATIRRIANLRNELGSIEMQRANNEIDIAQQRGGDVELARANALATELKVGLARLGDDMQTSLQTAETAESQFAAASREYDAAIRDGLDKLDPEKFSELSQAYDVAQKAMADANQAVEDQRIVFDEQKTLLIQNVEKKLTDLDKESKGALNDAADQVRTSIYDTIKEKFSTIGASTGEIAKALDEERAATTAAIQALAPKPADTAKVAGAVDAVRGGIDEQGNAFISGLATVSAVTRALADKARAQEAQIKQLFARIR